MRVQDHRRAGRSSIVSGFLVTAALVLLPTLAAAQATATIFGQVTDESGATLPGVTVTRRSPALQVPSVSANGQGGEMWSLLEGVFAAARQTSASGTHGQNGTGLTPPRFSRSKLALGSDEVTRVLGCVRREESMTCD